MKDINDFVRIICNNLIGDISIIKGRCNYFGTENIIVPVDIRDKNDHSIDKNWEDFI